MNLIREYVREILRENEGPKKFTVGYVLDSIKFLKAIEEEENAAAKAQKSREYKEKQLWRGAKVFAGLFPGGSATVKLAKIVRDATKKNIPDVESSKDPILQALDIDDAYAEMLDDDLEVEFIDEIISQLDSLDPKSPLPDMDKALEKYVQQKHSRTIDGAQLVS